MGKNNTKTNGWIYWIFVCLIIIGLLWLFYSDGPQEFVGLPVSNNRQTEMEETYEEEGFINKEVSNAITPRTPNISFNQLVNEPVITHPLEGEKKGEQITRRVFEHLFAKPFVRVRPDFLKNPETGRNLELDGYNEELKIAFEYNGIQHYHYPSHYAKNEEEFKKQLRRDQFKLDTCNRLGIYLVIVPYSVKHENILYDVWHKLHPSIRTKTVFT